MNDVVKNKIQQALDEQSLTATEAERAIGLPLASLRNFLKGRVVEPRFDMIVKVAQHLNINLSDLLSTDSNENEFLDHKIKDTLHEWDKNLFKDAVDSISLALEQKKYKPCYSQVLPLIESVYLYSLEHKNKSIDNDFVRWVIKQIDPQ